jgi:hypothetical protein
VQGGSTVGAGARDDLCGAAIYDRTHQPRKLAARPVIRS